MGSIHGVRFQTYGNYSSNAYGAHTLQFFTSKATYWFSYDTLVAFKPLGGPLIVRENVWGTTTGKHLNWIDDGDKKSRVDAEEFNRLLEEHGC